MNDMVRKSAAGILTVLVLFFTVLGILGIWGIIDIEHFFSKTLYTLLILFISSAILVFLYNTVFKGENTLIEKSADETGKPSSEPLTRGSHI